MNRGHAGAFWQPGDPTIEDKHKALQRAGASPVQHPSEFGPTLARLLGGIAGGLSSGLGPRSGSITRKPPGASPLQRQQQQQARKLHLDTKSAMRIWTDEEERPSILSAKPFYLALGIDRHTRDLCIWTCSEWSPATPVSEYTKIPWPPGHQRNGDEDGGGDIQQAKSPTSRIDSDPSLVQTVLEKFHWDCMLTERTLHLGKMLRQMAHLFEKYEAKSVAVTFLAPPGAKLAEIRSKEKSDEDHDHPLNMIDLTIDLDDAAYRSGSNSNPNKSVGRFSPEQYTAYDALQATNIRDEGARDADRHGLVYHRLSPLDQTRHVGIVVNGAGLAMNTVDELRRHDLPAANFLDTGGLATSATVQKSIEIILRDERVRVIFVNIFGGLTQGEMIARGILQALEAFTPEVPVVVVRIQGTGEEEGRRLLREEGGRRFPDKLFTYADFGEALDKVASVVKAPAEREPSTREFKRTWSG